MLKSKNEAWRRELRVWHRECLKRTLRERQLLLLSLADQLAALERCSLAAGEERLAHRSYYHCECFVEQACSSLYATVSRAGTEHCKQALLASALPARLAAITETVENKTLVRDELEQGRQIYSRLRVLESVTNLVSLLTEDEELAAGFGEYAVSLLLAGVKFRDPQLGKENAAEGLLHGLINLFRYQAFKAAVYRELREGNFEQMVRGYVLRLAHNRIPAEEVEDSLFTLFRLYVHYQQEVEPQDRCHCQVDSALVALISHLFLPEHRAFLDGFDQQFIEELLKLLAYFRMPNETALLVLRCMELAPLLPYADLLNEWTYHPEAAISIHDFSEAEIGWLLAMQAVEERDQAIYANSLAGSLVNLLLSTEDDSEAVGKVRRCLERESAWEELLERSQDSFRRLSQLLYVNQPPNPL